METPLPVTADAVIIGAGFAGLATAAELARQGMTRLVVVESEAIPGMHSSGRNAALARRVIEEAPLARLAVRSMARMATLTTPDGAPIFRPTGGLLLGDRALIDRLLAAARAVPELAADAREVSVAEAIARVPALAGAHFEHAIWTEGDGVVDIHALLLHLKAVVLAAGGTVHFDAATLAIHTTGGRVTGVTTARGTIATPIVVDAAGFYANRIAALAGLAPLPFEPVRRHLFVTAPTELVARDAPWVWDGTGGWYFRPEGAGLLMCACDATRWPDDGPIDTPTDPGAKDALAAKFAESVPGLAQVRPARGWAGLRVLTPDHLFVIGPDPRLAGFHWVAGLGGHGMTTSLGVGEAGAAAVLGQTSEPNPFAPDRLIPSASSQGCDVIT